MTHQYTYIETAVASPPWGTYTYSVPAGLKETVSVGCRVLVSFGHRTITAFVISVLNDAPPENIVIKPILDVLDTSPLFHKSHMPFFRWISSYYICSLGEVIKTALPGGITVQNTTYVNINESGIKTLENGSCSETERQLLLVLKNNGPESSSNLLKNCIVSFKSSTLNSLSKKGLVEITRKLKKSSVERKYETWVTVPEKTPSPQHLKSTQLSLFELAKIHCPLTLKDLRKLDGFSPSKLTALETKGFLHRFERQVYRDPFGETITNDTPPVLTDEQEKVIKDVSESLSDGHRSFLLTGVTGSGKTEVYMRLVQKALDMGKSALVLVPEISLISQTERRFRMRFGDTIAVIHSGLSKGEKFDQWLRIAEKKVQIVIGARSAIFAPLENTGIIIVDEEHDSSYKQENGLRYNARDLATVRAKLEKAVCLMGSATPSVQSFHNTITGKSTELVMTKRVSFRRLPEIELVDLKKYRDYPGIRSFITPPLEEAIARTLSRKEQVLLFLNKRGYASFPVCATCGETMKCTSCDISLTLHQSKNAYLCHMCGYITASNSKCRICNSSNIKNLGFGTERIETAVKALFPEASTARMDQDTTIKSGAMLKILKDVRDRKIDILVGTQMIAKGHDFPGITLAGVICADQGLNFPDFRSCERTFQLLAQVAGRAGRGEQPGLVIMQTYNPNHFSIIAAKKQDFREFYTKEINFRQSLGYPPLSRMIQFRISGKNRSAGKSAVENARDWLKNHIVRNKPFFDEVQILGPIEAPVFKMADHYRWQILLKSHVHQPLHILAQHMLIESERSLKQNGVRITPDIDPYYFM